MPKPPPAPTKLQLAADTLIAAPRVTDIADLRKAIHRIKALYYKQIGTARRKALRRRLDEHYTGLIAIMRGSDRRLAARARRELPPALIPKGLRIRKRR